MSFLDSCGLRNKDTSRFAMRNDNKSRNIATCFSRELFQKRQRSPPITLISQFTMTTRPFFSSSFFPPFPRCVTCRPKCRRAAFACLRSQSTTGGDESRFSQMLSKASSGNRRLKRRLRSRRWRFSVKVAT